MEVTIKKLDHFGRGITYIDGKICFIYNALPEEIVDIDIIKDKKKYKEAKVINFIKKSNKRVESNCLYYPICGGCDLRHMNNTLKDEFKENKVKEILSKFGRVDEDKINPIVKVNKENYRNKVIFHVKDRKLGFYKNKSHDLIEISKCLNVDDQINKLIPNLKELIEYKENSIKEIMVRVGNITKEILISITGKVNNNTLKNIDVLFINDKPITTKTNITSIIGNKKYLLTKDNFFQVNEYLTKNLYDEVVKNIKELKSKNVLDLYCGTGTIGIYISDYVKKVLGVEIVKSSIKSANLNKELNNIKNISFKVGAAEDIYPKLKEEFDTVICDPPRSGLDTNVVKTLKEMKPKNIIYISCDPVTLSRDLKKLQEKYKIIEVTPFDMFENTYHVESVTVLKRL